MLQFDWLKVICLEPHKLEPGNNKQDVAEQPPALATDNLLKKEQEIEEPQIKTPIVYAMNIASTNKTLLSNLWLQPLLKKEWEIKEALLKTIGSRSSNCLRLPSWTHMELDDHVLPRVELHVVVYLHSTLL